jgi:broad specificity phosphatase PhoE
MGLLALVRHGQASFLGADYDQLSPTGERQAGLLGEHWARLGVGFDRLFHGPRVRQRRTAEIAAAALRKAGQVVPDLVPLDELDELRIEGLISTTLPQLAKLDPELAHLQEELAGIAQGRMPPREFERRMARAFHLWITGAVQGDGLEKWPQFTARVATALAHMRRDAARGARVVGFTSAGTISAALQLALGVQPAICVELMWRVRNSSVTEFLFSGERFTLSAFNGTPHLEDGALITYR